MCTEAILECNMQWLMKKIDGGQWTRSLSTLSSHTTIYIYVLKLSGLERLYCLKQLKLFSRQPTQRNEKILEL